MLVARKLFSIGMAFVAGSAYAQVPDLLTSFDAGGRAFGAGGSLYGSSADTLSAHYNPAGLGYVSQPIAAVASRSFPDTKTVVTGPLNDLRLESFDFTGDIRLSHVGYAKPLGKGKGGIGISWTVGGAMHDDQFGSNLPGGISQYLDSIRINTSFLNLAWGRASEDQSFSFGLGVVVAMNSVYNRQRIVFTDPNIPTSDARSEDEGFGVGAIAGIILTPRGKSNLTIGASVRTPIEIQDPQDAGTLYSKIPGRAAVSLAVRQDGYRGGSDFMVYGLEIEHFFSTESSERVMQDSHTAGHIGMEYHYSKESFTIPIRVGYSVVPAGGVNFSDRNVFTYGIGYRPTAKNWIIDIAFGNADSGAKDTAFTFGIRF